MIADIYVRKSTQQGDVADGAKSVPLMRRAFRRRRRQEGRARQAARPIPTGTGVDAPALIVIAPVGPPSAQITQRGCAHDLR
jgi:hypothetical protein